MLTKKAGCILIDVKSHKVALVYREKQNDYSFPKGHMEEGENYIECALRETAEETKREAIILENEPVYIEYYTTPSGEKVEMHYFLAKDNGPSDNQSEDTHPTYWYDFNEVYDKLTYDSLKKVWNNVKDKALKYFE